MWKVLSTKFCWLEVYHTKWLAIVDCCRENWPNRTALRVAAFHIHNARTFIEKVIERHIWIFSNPTSNSDSTLVTALTWQLRRVDRKKWEVESSVLHWLNTAIISPKLSTKEEVKNGIEQEVRIYSDSCLKGLS